jgi:hypothetical protein
LLSYRYLTGRAEKGRLAARRQALALAYSFDVVKLVLVTIQVFWDATLCHWVTYILD